MMNYLIGLITLLALSTLKNVNTQENYDRQYAYEQNQSCSNLAKKYNYNDRGPDFWNVACNECRNGRQSPINILTRETTYDGSLKRFKFFNYDRSIEWQFDDLFEQNGENVN